MIYQLKIGLNGAKPPIWRRVNVSADTTLEDLHKIIQSVMGWNNAHLHQFIIDREYYAPPSEWDDLSRDYKGMKLSDVVFHEGTKFRYEYDFGDSWLHDIEVEKIKNKEKGIKYPVCIKGKRACPPEDCGGIWGYMELVDIMADEKHPSHKEMREWLGGKLDPEVFDINYANERLQSKDYGVIDLGFL